MAAKSLRREKIEGGFVLSYPDLIKIFPEAAGVSQTAFDLKCASAVVLKRFQPGEIICEEGEFGSTAFYIVKGKVNVFISSRASSGAVKKPGFLARVFGGARAGTAGGVTTMLHNFISTDSGDLALDHPIAALHAGDLFGEMTCRNFQPRSATVQATEPCEVIEMLRIFLDLLLGQTDREPEPEPLHAPGKPPPPKDEAPAPLGDDGQPVPPPLGQKPHKRREAKDKKPGTQWRTGYWHWDEHKAEFTWRDGGWETPKPNHFWRGGAWVQRSGEWRGIEGRRQPIILQKMPPRPMRENPTPAPSPDHQWRPGEWVWTPINPDDTAHSGNFSWVPGKWEKPKAKGAGWIPAHWETIGENDGFRYVEGREVSPFAMRMNETYRTRSLMNHLKSVDLFAQVDAATLSRLTEHATFKSCYPGEWICEQGDRAEHFYLIRSGMVKVVAGFPRLVQARIDAQKAARRAIMHVAKVDYRLQQYEEDFDYFVTLREKQQSERAAAEASVHLREAADEEAASVATYLRRGDYFGEMGLVGGDFPEFPELALPRRTASCIALDRVDLVVIHRDDFAALMESAPTFKLEIYRTVQSRLSKQHLQKAAMQSVASDFFEEKLFQAQNLLVINLDRCTRCDECVRACADSHDGEGVLHPVTKLVRDGRRYHNYLVTAACRSCFDPLCMTRCPVSSIRRKENLEIIIEDWCIGCGMCAEDCPFGNINMVPLFELVPSKLEIVQNGEPAELTLTGARLDRITDAVATLGKTGEPAPGIEVTLGGNREKRRIIVRATGSAPPDPKTKINLVLRLKDGSIIDFPSGSGVITIKPTGEKAENKPTKIAKLKASTCDLCSGLDMPSCVHACPHDAAMRVYPAEFFANGAPLEVKRQDPQPGDIDRRTTHIRLR